MQLAPAEVDALQAAEPRAPYLRLQGIRKNFGAGDSQTLAIDGVDLDVREGEFLAVIGPSGCGKSTLLQIAAGLAAPSEGVVSFEGNAVLAPPPGIVYLFQQYGKSLFPWRTVIDNVAFAIEHRPGMNRERAHAESRRYLQMVGLGDSERKYPWQLSGGMQQRVTIARALAAQPRVLLLDEPFSSVDALTRLELHALVLELWQQQRFTAVLVTHDVDEAVFLADRVAVLSRRPSQVVEVVETELPRPRDNIATRELPRFIELRHHLLSQLLRREA
ncbi:ABC transporter ATP-binding protein [Ramlibacter rhizophilus]|uniref:ABC transporter ATP-binding protein n=1 Tax=Ramlibacter rhizophilus TaxID=1781167 RepID=A0A4Z0BH24_9BURK|nr:ABC transporter ATP-binding protein [Ramlibacter rhizophilus]TFY97557.1 ABC transporter ATP-binding protein [Ramlibacter rhizophilus]